MLRSTLITAGTVALAAGATAQTQLQFDTPIKAPGVKYGGTYHTVTGTITRDTWQVSNFGALDAIYTNTSTQFYFTGIIGPTGSRAGGQITDTGGIPTTMNTLVSGVTRDEYLVTSFDFSYCDLDQAGPVSGWDVFFYESLAPGTSALGAPTVQTLNLTGLPTGGFCWVFNIDLSGGDEFCIGGDGGDGVFDNDLDFDAFGWGMQYTGTGVAAAGPLGAGDPSATDTNYISPNTATSVTAAPAATEGTGTYYNPMAGCTEAFNPTGSALDAGTGFGNDDFGFVDDIVGGGANSGAFYFANFDAMGNLVRAGYWNRTGVCDAVNTPHYSFYIELQSALDCAPGDPGVPMVNCAATANTSGAMGLTEALGSGVPSDNNLTLRASGLPTQPVGVFGIFLHSLDDRSGNPISVGQGVLCLGDAGRFGAPNQIRQADPNGVAELTTTTGDFDLANLPIASAPFQVAAMSGSTSYFGFWHRDFTTPQVSAFNFTQPTIVTWQ